MNIHGNIYRRDSYVGIEYILRDDYRSGRYFYSMITIAVDISIDGRHLPMDRIV